MKLCQQCFDIFIDINNILFCSLTQRHQIIAKSLMIVAETGSEGSTSTTLRNPLEIFVDDTNEDDFSKLLSTIFVACYFGIDYVYLTDGRQRRVKNLKVGDQV